MRIEKGLSIYLKSKKGEIKLVKWHRDTTKIPRFTVYEKEVLS